MKRISLTQGYTARVDDADYSKLMKLGKWYADTSRDTVYAVRNKLQREELGRGLIYMHRAILNAPSGREVDHVDGDGLNNTRKNLRLASRAQNCANKCMQKNNKSGYRGVHWYKAYNKWCAKIQVNRKAIHIGYFEVLEDAVAAYRKAAEHYFGRFARLT